MRTLMFFLMMVLLAHPAFAERPLETEGTDVLGSGQVLFELGAEHLENRQLPFDTSRVGRKEVALPQIGMAIGIGERVEIQGDFDVFYLDEDGRDETYDVGDFELWTKIKLFDSNENHPGMAVRFGTKLPNASNESRLGTDETDFLGQLIFGDSLGEVELRANVGIAILGNPNENNSQDDVVTYGGALIYPMTDRVRFFTEIFGQGASSEDNSYSSVRGGIIYKLNDAIDLDISGRAGITDESEDWGAGAGMTWQFDGPAL